MFTSIYHACLATSLNWKKKNNQNNLSKFDAINDLKKKYVFFYKQYS